MAMHWRYGDRMTTGRRRMARPRRAIGRRMARPPWAIGRRRGEAIALLIEVALIYNLNLPIAVDQSMEAIASPLRHGCTMIRIARPSIDDDSHRLHAACN